MNVMIGSGQTNHGNNFCKILTILKLPYSGDSDASGHSFLLEVLPLH